MNHIHRPGKSSISLARLCRALAAIAAMAAAQEDGGLEARFRDPPREDRPWVYWWWLKGNVDRCTITRDLEAIRASGFGGLLHFDVHGYHESHVPPPPERLPFMSAEWRRHLRFALEEAARVGLEVSVNLSSCAGALKGPWPVGDDAPKRLVWVSAHFDGPGRLDVRMPSPPPGFREIALLAARRTGSSAPPAPHPLIQPRFDGEWREVTNAAPDGEVIDAATVDLTLKHDADGRLTWEAPAGRWSIFWFGWTPMPGHEHDVDVLDAAAVRGHFERMGVELLNDAGPLAPGTLSHFYSVSWEGAAPTWTRGFEREFSDARGYDLRPWLPALAGRVVGSAGATARFLDDYYSALAACFMNRFYGTLRDLCRQRGLKWHAESGGPWDRRLAAFARADQLAFLGRTDMPQGEFWFPARGGGLGRSPHFNRPVAMAAHTYGRLLAAAEAFTHMVQHWSAWPAALKPCADEAFCDGINHLIWHTFTCSPPSFGLPGVEYFAGTHLNPNVTWWPMARAFVEYLARCQTLLRQGRPVADVCVYVGDRPYLHWGRGERWSERATLAAPSGRAYDLVNSEVLTGRLAVADGDLVLPEGLRYRTLVVDLDEERASPEALRRILEFAEQGATIVLGRRRPVLADSLADHERRDAEVRRLGERLWGDDPSSPAELACGRGRIARGVEPDVVLRRLGLPPDVEGPGDWVHRAAPGLDMYFVSGAGAGEWTFRVSGRRPELWDAVTGRIEEAPAWRPTADGRSVVALNLPPTGSVFVVFRAPSAGAGGWTNWPAWLEVRGGRWVAWRAEPARLAGVGGRDVTVPAGKLPPPVDLTGPWTVSFEAGRRAPACVEWPALIDWTTHADPDIRHFSGRATYRIAADLTAEQAAAPARLCLGRVGVVARVAVHGVDAGVVWTAPWEVDLTGRLREGRNEFEVEVANLWVNRLIGDAALPPEEKVTRTNVRLEAGARTVKVFQGFGSTDRLHPSGLMGPVRIEFGRIVLPPSS